MKYLLLIGTLMIMTLPVYGDSTAMSIGERFHHETGYGDSGAKGDDLKMGQSLPLYKTYDRATIVHLPVTQSDDFPVAKAMQLRRSVRTYSDKALTLPQLTRVCLAACGITHELGAMDIALRAAPSGGALYPIELYVIAHTVDSLADGLYHYQVKDTTLELIREGDFGDEINDAAFDQDWVGTTAVTLVLSARFARSTHKYFDRGYRYTYMEVGSICENIYLQATASGLGTVSVGAFNDDALNAFLGIDGTNEAALLIMPLGVPTQ
ncbi:MAG: SagB/ThcOx family dehydrogenase [candidate division Zixibacteria bacterium]|nr:SagB/ThcOx family dehydrogenase [candidate division Zixibacteria bacterium]